MALRYLRGFIDEHTPAPRPPSGAQGTRHNTLSDKEAVVLTAGTHELRLGADGVLALDGRTIASATEKHTVSTQRNTPGKQPA